MSFDDRAAMIDVTHRRNSGAFGFGLIALCGVKGGRMATNPKYVKCPACLDRIKAMRVAARKREKGETSCP